jgi:hypothetical protein
MHGSLSVPKDDNRQLRKLLKDDRERNRHLTEAPDCPDTDPPAYPAIRIQPTHRSKPRFQPSPVNRYQQESFKHRNHSGSHPSACMDTHPVRVVRGNIMRLVVKGVSPGFKLNGEYYETEIDHPWKSLSTASMRCPPVVMTRILMSLMYPSITWMCCVLPVNPIHSTCGTEINFKPPWHSVSVSAPVSTRCAGVEPESLDHQGKE